MRSFFYSLLGYFLTPGGLVVLGALDSSPALSGRSLQASRSTEAHGGRYPQLVFERIKSESEAAQLHRHRQRADPDP